MKRARHGSDTKPPSTYTGFVDGLSSFAVGEANETGDEAPSQQAMATFKRSPEYGAADGIGLGQAPDQQGQALPVLQSQQARVRNKPKRRTGRQNQASTARREEALRQQRRAIQRQHHNDRRYQECQTVPTPLDTSFDSSTSAGVLSTQSYDAYAGSTHVPGSSFFPGDQSYAFPPHHYQAPVQPPHVQQQPLQAFQGIQVPQPSFEAVPSFPGFSSGNLAYGPDMYQSHMQGIGAGHANAGSNDSPYQYMNASIPQPQHMGPPAYAMQSEYRMEQPEFKPQPFNDAAAGMVPTQPAPASAFYDDLAPHHAVASQPDYHGQMPHFHCGGLPAV